MADIRYYATTLSGGEIFYSVGYFSSPDSFIVSGHSSPEDAARAYRKFFGNKTGVPVNGPVEPRSDDLMSVRALNSEEELLIKKELTDILTQS